MGATFMSFFLDEVDCLRYKIEAVRQQMMQIAAEKKNFTDKAVVELSQELDIYLVEYQKRKYAARRYKVRRYDDQSSLERHGQLWDIHYDRPCNNAEWERCSTIPKMAGCGLR
ncbi:aspartyl-phosphate phosphatase Spo0E family protein [Paenibacillus thiaminolyticus]|uniref:aspartyl-phosphate phosphatase Spo0E family protein n=2 Tax=Paenibacillus thiaminolyticus TaxID=49283 RepID=UPI0030B934E0